MNDQFVEVFHNGSNHFSPFQKGDVMALVYTYDAPLGYTLEEAWRDNNVVVGDELPARHQKRSLSVGDGLMIHNWMEETTTYHVVEPVGFREVSEADFRHGVLM